MTSKYPLLRRQMRVLTVLWGALVLATCDCAVGTKGMAGANATNPSVLQKAMLDSLVGTWSESAIDAAPVCGRPRTAALSVRSETQVDGSGSRVLADWNVFDVNKTGAVSFSYSTVCCASSPHGWAVIALTRHTQATHDDRSALTFANTGAAHAGDTARYQ